MARTAAEDVLRLLFQPPVVTASFDLRREASSLVAEEAEALGAASPARLAEFAGGRSCARRALERLGVPAEPIGRGAEGQPLWPEGIVGAISHAGDLCVAAVARSADVLGVGIDIEIDGRESLELTQRICSARELEAIRKLGAEPEELARVVYSAKETLYKLQFPLTREVVGLRRVQVILSETTFVGSFECDLPPSILGVVVDGRWQRSAGRVWTGAWLPNAPRVRPLALETESDSSSHQTEEPNHD